MSLSSSQQATLSPVRVRYAETDQMGIVYYANYFVWLEIGRTDYCRELGFAYKEMEEQDGLYITVAETRCRYKAPARYDDDLVVRTRLAGCRKRVLVFEYEIERPLDQTLVAEAETVHVVTDRQGKPRTLPAKYLELFAAHAPDNFPGQQET